MYIPIEKAQEASRVLREAGLHSVADAIDLAIVNADLLYGSRASISINSSAAGGYVVALREPS